MKKLLRSLLKTKINIAIMTVLVALTFLLTLFITNNTNKAIPVLEEKETVDIKVIEESLRSVAELTTLTYNYTDVGIFSEQKTLSLFGNEIGILGTKKSFIITYDGEMRFGIDLSQISISEKNNVLIITLPSTQMFSHEVKEDSIKLLDEKTGLFSSFSVTDYADFIVEQKDLMETKALEKNLYSQAQSNAEVQIKSFISSIPGLTEEYEIRFVN